MDFTKGKRIISLAQAKQGREYMISNIMGGRCVNSHLYSIGIIPDEIVKVINKSEWGPIMVSVKGIRIALGRGISQKILINEIARD